MTFFDEANKLVPLETFAPEAFSGNDTFPQNVCSFILSLGLAYNDFRDVFMTRDILRDIVFENERTPTIQIGLRNGLRNTAVRIQVGFIHELLELIERNEKTITDATFKRVFSKLSKEGKTSWNALVNVATNKHTNDPLVNALLFIRNKVSFHYDSKELYRGYAKAFVNEKTYGKPFISRGNSLSETRFYFADASAEAYMSMKANESSVMEFLYGSGKLLHSINLALYEVVTRFIQLRSSWSKYNAGT